ncbi:MAG: 50S ribosomal protein L13 [bacterium]|nr:50S ribosomal protein L13 [bacterium]
MSTTMLRKEDVQRKWYVLDAAGKPLGKTAVLAADLLRGKRKPDYTPNADCGDYVIIINCKDAVLTGKKLQQKFYRTHSGYAGGLKETRYDRLMATRPELAMTLAVKGMLAKNPTQKWQLRRLKVYAGTEHKNAAQKPQAWEE